MEFIIEALIIGGWMFILFACALVYFDRRDKKTEQKLLDNSSHSDSSSQTEASGRTSCSNEKEGAS